MTIEKTKFGRISGQDVFILEMSNSNNLKVSVSNFGAGITSLFVPDKIGNTNIVLSHDSLKAYEEDPFYIGSTVGRFAGRISNGGFSIDDREYRLAKNAGKTGNHVHGGISGFNKKVFTVEHVQCNEDAASVQFYCRSEAMEEGYPGNLDVWISYELTKDNDLIIRYEATTDETTHLNLTNHSYFNLSGRKDTALEQELFINADERLIVDEAYIPTGAVEAVKNTPYDFNKLRMIATYSGQQAPAYNDYYILNKERAVSAVLFDPVSNRRISVTTSMPGLMLYTGDYLSGKFIKCQGVCLETQFFPDAPNRPEFPSTLLSAGQKFDHQTSFKFSW